MGLLTNILEEKHREQHDKAMLELEKTKLILGDPRATDQMKEHMVEQALGVVGIKGKDSSPMKQMLTHLLGIGGKKDPQQQEKQKFFQTPADLPPAQSPGPSSAPLPGGGGEDLERKPTGTPEQQETQRKSQQFGVTPMPTRAFKTSSEMEQERQKALEGEQKILSKGKIEEERAKQEEIRKTERVKDEARIALKRESENKLSPQEKNDIDRAKAVVEAEGGDSGNQEAVHKAYSQMLFRREAIEEKKQKAALGNLEARTKKLGAPGANGKTPKRVMSEAVTAKAAGDRGVDLAAWDYATTGHLPFLGMGGQAGTKRWEIIERSAQVLKDVGLDPSEAYAYRAGLKANGDALKRLTFISANMNQFEGTFSRNMETAEKLNKQFSRTDVKFANRLIKWYREGTGDPITKNFAAQLDTMATEYAKIMAGSTSAAGVTVNSDKEAREIIDKYLSAGQIEELFKLMRTDVGNRQASISQEKANLVDAIKGGNAAQSVEQAKPGPAGGNSAAPSGAEAPKTADEYLKSLHAAKPQ